MEIELRSSARIIQQYPLLPAESSLLFLQVTKTNSESRHESVTWDWMACKVVILQLMSSAHVIWLCFCSQALILPTPMDTGNCLVIGHNLRFLGCFFCDEYAVPFTPSSCDVTCPNSQTLMTCETHWLSPSDPPFGRPCYWYWVSTSPLVPHLRIGWLPISFSDG